MDGPQTQIKVEQAHFPLVLVRLTGTLGAPAAAAMIEQADDVLARGQSEDSHMFVVIDARRVEKLGAEFRRTFGQWQARIAPEQFARVRVRVMVHENPLVRGALTAMAWFSSRIKGVVAAKDSDNAVTVLRQALHAHGGLGETDEALAREWLDESARQ